VTQPSSSGIHTCIREGLLSYNGVGEGVVIVNVAAVDSTIALADTRKTMPLRDHFHAPFTDRRNWDEVHGGWPMMIVEQLVEQLPPEYFAAPKVHLGKQFEIDVGTFDAPSDEPLGMVDAPDAGNGGVATAVWAPPAPTLSVDTEMGDTDEYEVLVYRQDGRRLVAAIELISPANKDRPESRKQFVTKCAALLLKEVTVVLVDVVTIRPANLYKELLAQIGLSDPALGETPPAIYAAACRWKPRGVKGRLEAWYHPMHVDQPLPALPVWLSDDDGVWLNLESSYQRTCRTLRIG